jgi:hypothetical protein
MARQERLLITGPVQGGMALAAHRDRPSIRTLAAQPAFLCSEQMMSLDVHAIEIESTRRAWAEADVCEMVR